MVNDNKRSISENYTTLDFQNFINIYYSKVTDDWLRIMNLIETAFDIENNEDYDGFLRKFSLKYFDHTKMKKFYKKNRSKLNCFDDDVVKYISFIATLGYFEMIGNPTLDVWLNATDINHPYDKYRDDGFKMNGTLNLIKFHNGMNAVRNRLLSALKIIFGGFA